MNLYLLVLCLHTGVMTPAGFRGVEPDTLLDGTLGYRRVEMSSGPRQAAVQLLDANRWSMPGDEQWTGELYRVDVERRALLPVRLPHITAASDTLALELTER